MPHTSNHACECEHESHFGDKVDRPNIPATHPYAAVPADPDSTIKTEWGTFSVCAHCAQNHFSAGGRPL